MTLCSSQAPLPFAWVGKTRHCIQLEGSQEYIVESVACVAAAGVYDVAYVTVTLAGQSIPAVVSFVANQLLIVKNAL